MSEQFQEVMELINDPDITKDNLRAIFNDPAIALSLMQGLTAEERVDVLIAKNMKIFDGDINKYLDDFLPGTIARLQNMPEGPAKENAKLGQRKILEKILTKEGLTDENKTKITNELNSSNFAAAPAAGGKKKKVTRRAKRRHGKKSRVGLKKVNT